MKGFLPKLAVGLLFAGIIVAALVEGRSGGPPTGSEAPNLVLQKFDGGKVELSSLRGKLVLVNFWATWCPPCVEEMPYFLKVVREYEPKGLQFVAVSDDDPDTAKADVALFADRMKLDLTRYVAFNTPEAGRLFGVKALPTTVLIGPDGKVLASKRGMVSEQWLKDTLEEHLPK